MNGTWQRAAIGVAATILLALVGTIYGGLDSRVTLLESRSGDQASHQAALEAQNADIRDRLVRIERKLDESLSHRQAATQDAGCGPGHKHTEEDTHR